MTKRFKLAQLHEGYFNRHLKMSFGNVKPVERETPVIAVERWKNFNNHFLQKKFKFMTLEQRTKFVVEILMHETSVGHHATVTIDSDEVTLSLGNENLTLSLADKEFANFADLLYKDVTYNNLVHGYDSYENK